MAILPRRGDKVERRLACGGGRRNLIVPLTWYPDLVSITRQLYKNETLIYETRKWDCPHKWFTEHELRATILNSEVSFKGGVCKTVLGGDGRVKSHWSLCIFMGYPSEASMKCGRNSTTEKSGLKKWWGRDVVSFSTTAIVQNQAVFYGLSSIFPGIYCPWGFIICISCLAFSLKVGSPTAWDTFSKVWCRRGCSFESVNNSKTTPQRSKARD